MKQQRIGLGIAFGVALGIAAPSFGQSLSFGSVVVFNDEWPLTNTGFINASQGAERFVENFVGQMDPANGVSILIWSSNYGGEWTSEFRASLAAHGAIVLVSTVPVLPLELLLQYDGVIIAGELADGGFPDNQVLVEYVNAGGNVLALGGTGMPVGSVNPFLNVFGMGFVSQTNNRYGTVSIESSDPFFAGVGGLWQDNGNDIVRVGQSTSVQLFVMTGTDRGLYAVSRPILPDCDGDSVPDVVVIRNGANDADGNGVPDCCDQGIDCDCPGDVNDSGVVNAVDISIILSAWGTDGGKFPRADANNDGTVDASDLSIVLAGWGPCPN